MKKIISLLLCVALLCSMLVVAAHADATPAADFADVIGVPGGIVKINMNIANNTLGVGAFRFTIEDTDELGGAFVGADNDKDTLGFTGNDDEGVYFWSGSVNNFNKTFGTLTIEIPDDAELGDYTFTVTADQGGYFNSLNKATALDIAGTTFTVTVTDETLITGINVSIAAGLTLDVHVVSDDASSYPILVLDKNDKKYAVIDSEKGYIGDAGDFVFPIQVAPYAMDTNFIVDFAENFTFLEDATFEDEDALLDMSVIPETAKTVSILSYCNTLLAGDPSNTKLKQLVADMLEYGRQAQIYDKGKATLALPDGLVATEGTWEDFGTYCKTKYPESQASQNSSAAGKFKFDKAEISIGEKFVAVLTVEQLSTTKLTNARVKVGNGAANKLDNGTFTYAFSPMEYAGVEFNLYSSSTISGTNYAWKNTYGPAYYAAYIATERDKSTTGAGDLLTLLEAYYNYGVSAKAYAGA